MRIAVASHFFCLVKLLLPAGGTTWNGERVPGNGYRVPITAVATAAEGVTTVVCVSMCVCACRRRLSWIFVLIFLHFFSPLIFI